ncbi:MAG: 3-oxoacyl-[acyl-carrier protein] reductase [Planctomycetota bacterium]|jgi:3-oxoacyl-[acyl-carrier protein] reductase
MHIPAPVTLVTGSSRGLGREIANQFQERGDKIHVVWCTDGDRGAELQEDFRGRSHRHDLTEERAAETLVERILQIDGKLDHVVHCVGDYFSANLAETSIADWRHLFESNLATAIQLAGAVRAPLRESGGSLVFFCCAGVEGLRARRSSAAYAAMKTALMVFARSLALEEASHGVRINTISPGLIPHDEAHPDTCNEELYKAVPLGRAGTVEEVAAAALWLSSEGASYAVGVDLQVAGGWLQ